jgi:hypothetical protein
MNEKEKEKEEILKSTATNLALYLSLGSKENGEKFCDLIDEHFEFKENPAEWVIEQLNIKPQAPLGMMKNRFMHRDWERNYRQSKSMILDIYQLKNE